MGSPIVLSLFSLSLLLACLLARSCSSCRRMDIFEQLQGHFDVNNEGRVKWTDRERGKGRARERKRENRKRKGNTNEQRTLAYTHRSGILFWLGLFIGHHRKNKNIRVGGIYRSNRCSNNHLKEKKKKKKTTTKKWSHWSVNRVQMLAQWYSVYIRTVWNK